tara:strand:- start:298 stop:768 length:471 start_codon:yes stop_codon:yes gene_type:complete
MKNIRIVFGSDHAGYKLKEKLIKHVMEEYRGCIDELLDTGCETLERVDYPDYAKKVANELEDDNRRIGVLICGTGIGIGIAANRFEHIRCALCDDNFSAEMARKHNDANCLSLGARRTSFEDSCKILKIFINTEFEGGRHQKRLDKINHLKTMLSD